MRSEMAYKFKGSGFDVPEEKRKYKEPDKKLREVFEKWFNSLKNHPGFGVAPSRSYSAEFRRLTNLAYTTTVDDLHALFAIYQDDQARANLLGLFASAFYNKSDDKIIEFDVQMGENSPECLAYRLAEDKTIITKADVAGGLGMFSFGTIINCKKAGNETGEQARGPIINYGEIASIGNTAGPILNYGHIEQIGKYELENFVINFGTIDAFKGGLAINAGLIKIADSGPDDKHSFIISTRGAVAVVERADVAIGKLSCKDKDTLILKPNDVKRMPRLEQYLNSICQHLAPGKEDYKYALRAVKELGPEPKEKIGSILEKMLREGGHDV